MMEGLLFLLVFLAVYILPAHIAHQRGHMNRGAITALNILLGWTILGWIGAFVWAFTANTEKNFQRANAQS